MATIQQSIEIGVAPHVAYNQLTQFEEYPRFMESVESVDQLDDTHLRWKVSTDERDVEWDARIIEQEPDRRIAWQGIAGATDAGAIEVQDLGPDRCRIVMTLELPGENTEQLQQDLLRLKDFLELRGRETGAWRGAVQHGDVISQDRDADEEGTDDEAAINEEPSAPLETAMRSTADIGNEGAGTAVHGRGANDSPPVFGSVSEGPQGDDSRVQDR